jgi:hypothetical protein
MDRRRFITIAGGTTIAVGSTSYLLSDKSNLLRADMKSADVLHKTGADEDAIITPTIMGIII